MEWQWRFVKHENTWLLAINSIEKLGKYMELTERNYSRILVAENLSLSEKNFLYMAETMAEAMHTNILNGMSLVLRRFVDVVSTHILNGKTIYVTENLGYQLDIPENVTALRDKLIFPNYTKKDIKISQQGRGAGFHYYAHVGKIEVRDGDTLKWDTYEDAYKMALKYVLE